MRQSTRSAEWKLRDLERRLAAQQRTLERLERIEPRLVAAPSAYEWRCDHCRSGWIVHDGDELRCTGCGYLQYL